MIYLTFKISRIPKLKQLDLFSSILNDIELPEPKTRVLYDEYCTITTPKEKATPFNTAQADSLFSVLERFVKFHEATIKRMLDSKFAGYYTTFRIPKASGGFRTIEAPNEELKTLLRELKDLFQYTCYIHPHNTAYAYVPGRCAKHALERHQYNQSRHYLHLDLKDFFTNCTADFIHQQLRQVFPFSKIYEKPTGPAIMDTVVQLALYNGHLPQGTPLSPYLTNIIMIPIDHAIYTLCRQRNKQHLVYTRYADDIDISSKYDFDYKELVKEIELILAQQSPLKVNYKKIHYGTTAGRNWHLGLMLNQNNEITIGHKRKREIKTTLLNYCKNKANWSKEDMQSFHGELAYFRSIEPVYHDYLVNLYSTKYNNSKNIVLELRESIS